MTSIEWLFEKLWEEPKDKLTWHSILEQAKEMHKQEIIDCYNTSFIMRGNPFSTADKYYEEISAEAKSRAANYMNLKQK
jgi:hypothetical protein